MDIYTVTRQLNEEPLGSLLRKQDSITRLFPPFYDRVKAVGKAGGISLHDDAPGLWHFNAASATHPGLKYDVYVEFRDIVNQLEDKLQDMRLWNKEKTDVDMQKVAREILKDSDLKIHCSCPAFQYWGPAYITTQRKSNYGDKEGRPPDVRNPKRYGVACKHCQLMFDVLPFYEQTLAKHLNRYFKKEIAAAVEKAKKTQTGMQKATAALKAKMEPPKEEPPKAEPKKPEPPKTGPVKPGAKPIGHKEQEAPSESRNERMDDAARQKINQLGDELMALSDTGKDPARQAQLKAEIERLRNEALDPKKLGQCYALSGRYVLDNPKTELVHGTITRKDGYTIDHAWAERTEKVGNYDIRMVHDPVLEMDLPWDAYERLLNAKIKTRYTHDAMVKAMIKAKHWGPWESVVIDEAFNQYEYSPSEDKKELMLDFYLLDSLPKIKYAEVLADLRNLGTGMAQTGGGRGAIRQSEVPNEIERPYDPQLQYVLHENKRKLNKYLQEHLLEAVFFAICCEFRHIFDLNSAEKIMKWAKKEGPTTERFMQKYGAEYTLRKGGKQAYVRQPELKVSHEDESPIDRQYTYQSVIKAMKAAGIDEEGFVSIAEAAYEPKGHELSWAGSYGGHMWALICKGWKHLKNSSEEDLPIWIDHVYSLQHNTNTVMNKLKSYYRSGEGYDWIKQTLDFKFNADNIYQFMDRVSPDLKEFAAAVIKDMTGQDLESWQRPQEIAAKKKKEDAEAKIAAAAKAAAEAGKLTAPGAVFKVTGGDGITKTFTVGGQVIYKSGSNKEMIGKQAKVIGPGGGSKVHIKFNSTTGVWAANAKNLDIVTGPKKYATPKTKYAVGMKGTYRKGDYKVQVEIGEISGDKIYLWTNDPSLQGTVGKIDPQTKNYKYSWVTDGLELDNQFVPDFVQMSPVAGEKPTAIGEFAMGDMVKYTGTTTPKLFGDVGQIINFNKNNHTIAGVKFQKLGQVVWVSLKSIAQAEPPDNPNLGPEEPAPSVNNIVVGDKVEFTGDKTDDPYYNKGDKGEVVSISYQGAGPGKEIALVKWDNGQQVGAYTSELKKISATPNLDALVGKKEIGVGDKVKYTGTLTKKLIGKTGVILKTGLSGKGGAKVKIKYDDGYTGTAYVNNLEKIGKVG